MDIRRTSVVFVRQLFPGGTNFSHVVGRGCDRTMCLTKRRTRCLRHILATKMFSVFSWQLLSGSYCCIFLIVAVYHLTSVFFGNSMLREQILEFAVYRTLRLLSSFRKFDRWVRFASTRREWLWTLWRLRGWLRILLSCKACTEMQSPLMLKLSIVENTLQASVWSLGKAWMWYWPACLNICLNVVTQWKRGFIRVEH